MKNKYFAELARRLLEDRSFTEASGDRLCLRSRRYRSWTLFSRPSDRPGIQLKTLAFVERIRGGT